MLTRRQTLTALVTAATAAAAPALAGADDILRLGVLSAGAPAAPDSPSGKILIGALADLGYAPAAI